MSEQSLSTIDNAYAAFARGDVPAVLALLSDDVEWSAPDVLPHGRDANGPAEVGEFFGGMADQWSDFGIEIDDITDTGDKVISIGRASGDLGGTRTGYGFAHVFTVRDGTIVRFDEYVAPPQGGFPG